MRNAIQGPEKKTVTEASRGPTPARPVPGDRPSGTSLGLGLAMGLFLVFQWIVMIDLFRLPQAAAVRAEKEALPVTEHPPAE